ncbi:MAG: pentapeptide repeat-containing protein [Moorea sp. SIOASIH]|uniref:pentapeptide repeat-containing protein n=1 Tax=Moorena sp. SIOASIH TaxID=2607817 RepID=UPI0013BA0E95|nr:pentapeptide repeat-containing protein [Moorena sp. SIOASIH]NEO36452.1 pentapeptide repeat-containing protein [Moorena sp. SIOASIH]
MKNCSPGKKNKKLTITASSKGIEKAEKALIRLGFNSKTNFAKSQFISRSTVTKFFNLKPIQLDSFKRICHALKLDWREIVGIEEEKRSELLTTKNSSSSELVEGVEQGQAPRREVTVIDKQSQTIKASIVLEGDINLVQNPKFIEWTLQLYSGDSINIIDIKPGSIRLRLEGSPEDIERLVSQIESGEVTELSGFPVQDIEILRERSEDDQKWRLVEEIASFGAVGRYLSYADLSDADLSDADLSRANLSVANLSGADLSDANLMGANLIYANLIDANLNRANLNRAYLYLADLRGAYLRGVNLRLVNLSDADLSNADLRGAYLRGANLSNADLSNADLSNADLRDTFWKSAKLSGAQLICAYLIRGANLIGAYLIRANLIDANLRGAELSGADLRGAELSGADLRGAELSGADLRGADLRGADLRGAELSGADLRGANLRDANLIRANLNNAEVKKARFEDNLGIDESMKRDLIKRGAIFKDLPGNRSALKV